MTDGIASLPTGACNDDDRERSGNDREENTDKFAPGVVQIWNDFVSFLH